MIDQSRYSVPECPDPYRSSRASGKTTRSEPAEKPPAASQVDVTAMVRSLQRTAGVADCFRKGNVDCDDIKCDWRVYCLEAPSEPLTNRSRPPEK